MSIEEQIFKIFADTNTIPEFPKDVVEHIINPFTTVEATAVFSTQGAFACILSNGRVVTWGNPYSGGDSSAVQDELKDQVVQKIYSTSVAFAAVLGSGRVVTWGSADFGGDSSSVLA